MNLALDFDMIATNAGSAPKYMEWYGGFSLLVTLIWLYIEFLRLAPHHMARLDKVLRNHLDLRAHVANHRMRIIGPRDA